MSWFLFTSDTNAHIDFARLSTEDATQIAIRTRRESVRVRSEQTPTITMSRIPRHSTGPPRGWITLVLTFVLILAFRLQQNVAFVLDVSTRELVGLDVFPIGVLVPVLGPVLHADAGHLVSTLIWFVPFGYFLERRTGWADYVGFVVLAGVLSTTLVPAAFVVLGVATGLGVGASGITHALVGREATARSRWVLEGRSLSRRQRAILGVAILALLLRLLSFTSTSPETSVVGHATGLVVGVAAGIGERYVTIADK